MGRIAFPNGDNEFAAVFISFLEQILISSRSAFIPEFVMPCRKQDKQGCKLYR